MSSPHDSPAPNPPSKSVAAAASGFTSRIARSFLLLSMLTVAVVGTVAYIQGRNALESAARSRLQMTATLKQKEITRWLESCEEDFLLMAEFPTVKNNIQILLTKQPDTPAYQQAYESLSAYFEEIREIKPKFTEISIQNKANRIIFSTNPELEGKYEISTNLTEVKSVVPGEKFAPNFYLSPATNRPAITYSSKVFNSENQRQGMIIANLNLKRIDDIISERTGLNEPGETYLVGSLSNKFAFLARRDTLLSAREGPRSEGIEAAFRGENGSAIYDNYEGKPVIGVYRWLAAQNIALLVEIGKVEAFAPARNLAASIVIVGLGSVAILLLGVSRLARQLSLSRRQIDRYSRQLEQTAATANAANQAKSEFLANMSHELRTPLNAILGFTQLMQRESDSYGPHHKYLKTISRSGEHLLNLINDVLSMSKIEAGRTTFDPVCFDLRYLLLTLEEMFQMRAEAKAIQLRFKVEETVPQFIKTDEVKLRQVLVNLVGNAIKFTQAGHVTLSVIKTSQTNSRQEDVSNDVTVTESHSLCFSIQDTGPGIDPDEVSRLFDAFFQASKTRKSYQGTGLGLSISQRFVQLLGGDIHVESAPGKGSTFSFCIQAQPADLDQLPVMPLGEVVGIVPNQPAYRILVVEDVLSARQLMVALLSQVGFGVQTAKDGESAIATYKSWHPHLIWMDIRLPIMDGYEATKRIRDCAGPPVKIIAITASAFEKERDAVLASGCDDFVRKPFHAHLIFEKMAEHLGIKYLYKNDLPGEISQAAEAFSGEDSKPSEPIDPEHLKVMPTDWLQQLHQAAIEVDAEALQQLITQIPQEHHTLAHSLQQLVQQFCFDELIDLTGAYV
ncbi:MAG: ATP-binding protein [Cyanobacteria bacterium J06597_16]